MTMRLREMKKDRNFSLDWHRFFTGKVIIDMITGKRTTA